MRRAKDEEKIMGPMFPRLHLNDTEKGGPRAPPRNKMAFYEQLSIPSQRFKPGVVPINPSSATNMIRPVSTRGNSQQRGALFSHQFPASKQVAEQVDKRFSESKQHQPKNKSEEDDFSVPVFMQASGRDDFNKYHNNNGETLLGSSQAATQHSTLHVPAGGNEIWRSVAVPTKAQGSQSSNNGENVEEFLGNSLKSLKTVSNSSSIRVAEVPGCRSDAYKYGEKGNDPIMSNSVLLKADHDSLPQQKSERHPTRRVLRDVVLDEPTGSMNSASVLRRDYATEERRSIDVIESCTERTCGPLPVESADVDDHSSEISMVDCVSELVISPDDVVGIIGQKHFWKARRAIVNQQRVFAVQVFELHRLIKVQKLMAGSPDILLDSSFLEKPSKASSTKKLPLEYIVKKPLDAVKPKSGSEKANDRMEGSAENHVGKESYSSVQNGGQSLSSKPVSINSPMTPVPSDHALGSWCFNQPQGHQWLLPVMSPSEGLVYKPYPGPGFMGLFCGGCRPPGAPPMVGNFFSPAYGVPACYQLQGMGISPFASQAGLHGYFPPHSMPVMNHSTTDSTADQTNHSATSGLPIESPELGACCHQTRKSSCQKDEADGVIPVSTRLQESRDSEVQASSPSERGQATGRGKELGGRNTLHLFLRSPVTDHLTCNTQTLYVDKPAQVIKVVPHDGISATESAVRIFQSIQQERKQHDA